MMDAENPMPMKERYLRRFPQPARVGDLIGMNHASPADSSTIMTASKRWNSAERRVAVPARTQHHADIS